MILLVTNKFDLSIDYVVEELRKRGTPFARLNAEDIASFPCTVQFFPNSFSFQCDGGPIEIYASKIQSIYFRRPGKPFEWSEELDASTAAFCADQWGGVLQGLLSLQDIQWVNYPLADRFAESKIVQLRKAQNIGFSIPQTCITNDKATAQQFLETQGGRVVAKALETPLIVDDDEEFFIYSNVIEDLSDPEDSFRISPTIFQEYISEKVDIRVTVIGRKVFPVRISRIDRNPIGGDWRVAEKELLFEPIELPQAIAEYCINLVHDFGIVFGAIDLLKKNNEYYFLEINPRGEWGWLQAKAGLPIAQSIVDVLSMANND